ncbi:hypothetical protein PMIT1318_02389 [Prochlorococcus marinus str. MIT 1318]|nr:hypothetical protein PMIT1318_02389 [Prochlorococcus marinus str. MIT 1318]
MLWKRHGIAHSKLSFLSFTSSQHKSQNNSLDPELKKNQQKTARLDMNSKHYTLLYMAPQSFKMANHPRLQKFYIDIFFIYKAQTKQHLQNNQSGKV